MNLTAKALRELLRDLPKVPEIVRHPYVPTGQAFQIRSSLVGGPVLRELEGKIFVSEADYQRSFESKP